MRLESGPARGDTLYYGVFLLVCAAMAAWFFYDGKWGYLKKNLDEARKQIKQEVEAKNGSGSFPADLGGRISEAEFKALAAQRPTSPAQVRAQFGEPILRREASAGESIEIYVSNYGQALVPLRGGAVQPDGMQWRKWVKDRDEIQNQYYLALIPLAMALYAATKMLKAMTLRATIDDSALRYGATTIPLPAMKRLVDYNKKGWVDLYYEDSGGQEQKLRIDNQKISKFDAIIDEICKVKEFPDPRKVVEDVTDGDE